MERVRSRTKTSENIVEKKTSPGLTFAAILTGIGALGLLASTQEKQIEPKPEELEQYEPKLSKLEEVIERIQYGKNHSSPLYIDIILATFTKKHLEKYYTYKADTSPFDIKYIGYNHYHLIPKMEGNSHYIIEIDDNGNVSKSLLLIKHKVWILDSIGSNNVRQRRELTFDREDPNCWIAIDEYFNNELMYATEDIVNLISAIQDEKIAAYAPPSPAAAVQEVHKPITPPGLVGIAASGDSLYVDMPEFPKVPGASKTEYERIVTNYQKSSKWDIKHIGWGIFHIIPYNEGPHYILILSKNGDQRYIQIKDDLILTRNISVTPYKILANFVKNNEDNDKAFLELIRKEFLISDLPARAIIRVINAIVARGEPSNVDKTKVATDTTIPEQDTELHRRTAQYWRESHKVERIIDDIYCMDSNKLVRIDQEGIVRSVILIIKDPKTQRTILKRSSLYNPVCMEGAYLITGQESLAEQDVLNEKAIEYLRVNLVNDKTQSALDRSRIADKVMDFLWYITQAQKI